MDISPLMQQKLTGVGEYILGVVKEYSNYNIDRFELFGFVPWNYNADRLNELGLHNIPKKLIRFPTRLSNNAYLIWQKINYPPIEAFIGNNFDIYHVFDWYTPWAYKTKVITTVYDFSVLEHPYSHKKSNVRLQSARLKKMEIADGIVCISEFTKQSFIHRFPFFELSHITVAYPGIKHAFLFSINKAPVKLFSPYILVVSTKEPRKNLETVAQAFINIKHRIPYKLIIVGDTGWLNVQIANDPDIIKLNYVNNQTLANLYNNCEFSIYLSSYEGFGLPVIESLFFGKHVITSDHSGLQEAASNYATIVKDVTNLVEIQNAIVESFEKIQKEENEVKLERRKYSQKFLYRNSVNKINNLYLQVLGRITTPPISQP